MSSDGIGASGRGTCKIGVTQIFGLIGEFPQSSGGCSSEE